MLDKITFEEKEYNILFGYTGHKMFISGILKFKEECITDEGLTVLGMSKLFHAAHVNYCMDQNKQVQLSFDKVTRWLDKMYESEEGKKEVGRLLEIWASTEEVGKLKESIESEGEKKNQETVTETLIA